MTPLTCWFSELNRFAVPSRRRSLLSSTWVCAGTVLRSIPAPISGEVPTTSTGGSVVTEGCGEDGGTVCAAAVPVRIPDSRMVGQARMQIPPRD